MANEISTADHADIIERFPVLEGEPVRWHTFKWPGNNWFSAELTDYQAWELACLWYGEDVANRRYESDTVICDSEDDEAKR